MFHSIRRHQKWLWAVITILTIVSFVIFFSPQQSQTQNALLAGDSALGSINGRSISRAEYVNAYREAELGYFLGTGNWPRNDEMSRQLGLMEREVRNRLFLAEKLREFDVLVSDKAIADWIAQVFRDRETQVFRKQDVDNFITTRLSPQNLTADDFTRYVRHEVGIQHLRAMTGLSGKLVTPQEAEIVYRRENEEADTQVVFLQTSNYLAGVTIDPAALMTFYTNQQANYRISERVQVTYVKFEATNYFAEAEQKLAGETNLTMQIEAAYAAQGPNAFKDANNQPLSAEAAKAKIRDDLRMSFALREARRKAIEFANELIELPPATNNLANLAAAKGILSKVTEPFSGESGPTELKVPETFIQAAFLLAPDNPTYEQPIIAEDGVYLIGYNRRIPSEIRPFESVRDRVTEEFRRSEVNKLVAAAGRDLHTRLTNSISQGKTFEAACQEANQSAIDLPPFSQKTMTLPQLPNRGEITSLKTAAFALAPGKTSEFTSTRDGGFVLFLQAKVPVTDEKMKAELPEFLENLQSRRQSDAFSQWLRKEMEMAQISLPDDKKTAN